MDIKRIKEFFYTKRKVSGIVGALIVVCALVIGIIFGRTSRELDISDSKVPSNGGADVYNATFFIDKGTGASSSFSVDNYLRVGNGYFVKGQNVKISDVGHIDFNGPDCSYLICEDEIVVWDRIEKVAGRFFVLGHVEVDESYGKNHVGNGAYYYDSVAQMLEAGLSEGDVVVTGGYYAVNDGGDAVYDIIPSSSKVTNKSATIQLNNGNYAVMRIDLPELSVKQFGATGDGVTDDSAALNRAMNCSEGKTLFVPAGTYRVGAVVRIPSNIHIIGVGQESKFMAADYYPVGSDVLKASNKENIVIEAICIDGKSDVNTRELGHGTRDGIHLLDIWNTSNISITDCYFQNNIYAGIRFVGSGNNLKFTYNTFKELDCGVIVLGNGDIDGFTVSNCYFDGHLNSEPISLFGKGHVKNVLVENNRIMNKTYGHSIFIGNGATYDTVSVVNNYMVNNAVGILCDQVTNLIIKDNTIDNTVSGAGIKLVNCSNGDVFKNHVRNTCLNGFYIEGCSDVNIHQNDIFDCGFKNNDFFPMDLRGTCSNVDIVDNWFERTDDSLLDIFIACRCTGDVEISKNTFVNCKIWLGKNSEGVHVFEQDVKVRNDSAANVVE